MNVIKRKQTKAFDKTKIIVVVDPFMVVRDGTNDDLENYLMKNGLNKFRPNSGNLSEL
jgi:hypothetical protein